MSIKDKISLGTDANLQLAFDVGHSSIGWAVLQSSTGVAPVSVKTAKDNLSVNILGCGSVVFRADDCLASSRRAYRRQRRHIRSTKQRIARMKIILKQLGVLKENELNQLGCAWPWQLAARVLQGGKSLTWTELWDVLRWYAHNRGYDGNRRWSAAEAEAQKEDSEKEANARTLMGKHGVHSMAETFCKELGVEPLGKKKSSMKRFKGLNAAFPREVVESEVRKILQMHSGKLKGVDANLEKVLFSDWCAIPCPDLKLPKRYEGGLLFGQLVPRFDNRIISTCPICDQKVPSRNCPEFLNFRWAMQLANIKVGKNKDRELQPLKAEHRVTLDKQMRERGYLTPKELKDAVRSITSCERDNLDTMLMHPDAKEALLLDPVQKLICSDDLQPFWKLLPERLQKRLRGQWRRNKVFTLAQIRKQLESLGDVSAFDAELQKQLDTQNSKAKKKEKQVTHEELLQKHFPSKPLKLDGRAAFARHLLKQAYEDVLAGKPHPKEEDGCLFITEKTREAQLNRAIADQTNNHLVRHRLLILERLLADIIKEYAAGDKKRIGKITIEVNRDLREMSGKTAKEKAQDLGLRIANHHAVAEKLEKAFAEERNGKSIPITAGLIRKARVAEDLGWRCPYTGVDYEPKDLVTRRVDKDHIVPRSERASDSLDSLVITFSAINKWKGKRTAWQFVSDEQGKPVPDLPNLSIVSLTRYKQFVESLETYKGHDDDKRRKKRRKDLMLLPKYEEKEFTPRDLTQTSQLVRLGAQVLRKNLPHLTTGDVTSLPGSVTGTVRKAWKVLGCLATANPQVLDENGDVKNKTDIREITHLHHALDACVLGLASYFIPNNGRVWELIVKRNPNDLEKRQLEALGVFGFNAENRFEMHDLDNKLKEQIRQRLAEKRVVQHIPARMDGLRVEQNTWGVGPKNQDGTVLVHQRIRQPDGSRKKKEVPEKKVKLLGLTPSSDVGKLSSNNGVLVIPDNYGVAILDHAEDKEDKFVIIPWHKVWVRVFKGFKDKDGKVLEKSLVERNGGKMPRILRNGQIVRVPRGTYKDKGAWKITSIKNQKSGIKLNLGQPDTVNTEEEVLDSEAGKKVRKVRPDCKHEASLVSIVSGGLQILTLPLTGFCIQPLGTK
ncbi:MAG: type II CRISPR RNA-guided endonuclease Cas9 [Verrucomicrobiota bacterium]|jgi:CRISPR-associated endonuclease Csn1